MEARMRTEESDRQTYTGGRVQQEALHNLAAQFVLPEAVPFFGSGVDIAIFAPAANPTRRNGKSRQS
ncbi:unnamed protein product [Heligmosomoides polygyrus]|uniref:Transcriptional regulator n=1 Tax=Heligmosomoides polygyrus TaxID=6339 RepID=A0A183GDT9_HELPZ|nr:unnamed protein product [Heligmosomoides polygyrus]